MPTPPATSKQQLERAGIDGRRRDRQRHQGRPRRRHPPLRPLLQRLVERRTGRRRSCRNPRPDLHRRAVRRPEPAGRHAADQLRPALEPGPADAAHRPRRPPPEPGRRGTLVADHPDQKALRGKVAYWNFLPPDELNDLLQPLRRCPTRPCASPRPSASKGKKLLTPEDDYEALKDFNQRLRGDARRRSSRCNWSIRSCCTDNPELEADL